MKKSLYTAAWLCAAAGVFCLFAQQVSAEQQVSPAKMVQVPAGSFKMGSSSFANAQPVHEVKLTGGFAIGKYEVTNQQYADMLNYAWQKGYLDKAAMAESAKRREARGVSRSPQKYQDVFDEHSQITFSGGTFAAHPGKENFPVVEVSWYGAAFYCNMLSEQEGLSPLYNLDDWSCQVYGKTGYRLPTEAEWEYAATYNDGRPYPWGKAVARDTLANIKHTVKNPVDVDTRQVGSYSPKGDSKLGIADMAGNVAEWCNDWYNDFYPGDARQTDPVGSGQSLFFNLPVFKEFRAARVVRGGSFLLDPGYRKEMGRPFVMDCVLTPDVYNNRYRSFDHLSRQVIGFRVVRTDAAADTPAVFSAPEK